MIRYKGIAAIIIKYTIPQFRNRTLEEISRCIVDRRPHKGIMSKLDIIEDEIDFLPSEAGTKDEKNTISDSIFDIVNNPTSIALRLRDENVDMTINIEMQKETRESVLGYNIISRAIYYGASVLRDTVKAGDTKYSGIHKVYTIWLCAKKPKFRDVQR